jgi:hypothetical protein
MEYVGGYGCKNGGQMAVVTVRGDNAMRSEFVVLVIPGYPSN